MHFLKSMIYILYFIIFYIFYKSDLNKVVTNMGVSGEDSDKSLRSKKKMFFDECGDRYMKVKDADHKL